MGKVVEFRCHTQNLLQEIMNNPSTGVLRIPLNVLLRLLKQVAERATQLNDPELDRLMLMLALYDQAEPTSENYDPDLVTAYADRTHEAFHNDKHIDLEERCNQLIAENIALEKMNKFLTGEDEEHSERKENTDGSV